LNTSGYVVLTYRFDKEGRRYNAYCEELGTATFGRSLNEAKARLQEAILLHLNTLEDLGEREKFFHENNIKFLKSRPRTVNMRIPTKGDFFIQASIQRIPALSNN